MCVCYEVMNFHYLWEMYCELPLRLLKNAHLYKDANKVVINHNQIIPKFYKDLVKEFTANFSLP